MSEFPFQNPSMYNPMQFAFTNNAEMSQLISMIGQPLLAQMAGPGNFLPHMMPGQALFDQFAMRNYQQQAQMATFNLAGAQNDSLSNGLLGVRSMFTNNAPTDLTRAQTANIAGTLNNPVVKSIMGMALGPENVEALLHGSKGDVQNLGSAINRIGYFRRDPSGGSRMDAESLEDFTTGVFSHLYEPQGDLNKLANKARKGDEKSLQRLREAAQMEDATVISDADVESRLLKRGENEVGSLYQKYVQGGTATDAATQAKELLKFDRAIQESGVLRGSETTIGAMTTRADRMPVDEMHGFMAGQVSQLTENLSQRGMLPQSIGGLSGKERVGAIAETKLDDATLDRLAQTMARRDLESRDDDAGRKYRALDPEERQKELERVSGGYRANLESTKSEAEKFARGESTKSAEDILQGAGGDLLAGNVDASRTASKVKGYTDALAAVRDIFGDNGNPNAPMPALMAALDQLTQGGLGQMDPAKVATTLRQMQTLAKETGTGMKQLGVMTQVAGNIGQQLGLAPSVTMQNVAASMGITKAAMDSGAFSSGVFGGLSKEQFQTENVKDLQTSAASGNGKALAAMNRIYKMDPKKFAGTELEAAMAAYNDPSSDGSYTFKDKDGKEVTRNLYKDIGRGRQFAAQGVIERSGGSQADFYSVVNSPLTQQFANADKAYLTQKHQTIQRLSQFGTRAHVRHALGGDKGLKDAGLSGRDLTGVSNVITGMVIDVAADLNPEDQITYLQNNMKDKLKEHFIAQGKSEEEAERLATQTATKMGSDRSSLSRLVGNLDTYAASFGMGNLTVQGQKFGKNRDVRGIMEGGVAARTAEAKKRMVGYETTVGQRFTDYLIDIGKRGENFNVDQLAQHVSQTIGDEKVLHAFAGRMGAGMHTLANAKDEYQITDKDIEELTAKAAEGNKDAEEKLRKHGKIKEGTEIIYQSEIENAKKTKLDKMGEKDVEAAYAKATGGSGAHKTTAAKREFLRQDAAYAEQFSKDYVSGKRAGAGDKKYVTEKELTASAMHVVGEAKEGKDQNELARLKDMQKAMERGQDASALKVGLDSFFESKEFSKGLKGIDRKKLEGLIKGEGNSQKEILAMFGMSEEEFKKGQSKAYKDKSNKQRAAEVSVGFDAAKEVRFDAAGKPITEESKQKVDKAQIDATTVVVNAGKMEGGAASIKAAGTALPNDMKDVDAELETINKRGKENESWVNWDGLTKDEAARKAELLQKKEQLAKQAADEKTRPEGAAAAAAGAAAQKDGAGVSSANVTPAATSSPQQSAPASTTAATAGQSGGGGGPITLDGTLRIEGMYEAVIAATTRNAINPPNGGPTIVPDRPSTASRAV